MLRYYWSVLLKDVMPFSEVKKRFVQLSLNDPTVRPLSYKILENPEFIVRDHGYLLWIDHEQISPDLIPN